jgi:regulator of replication initiation timing
MHRNLTVKSRLSLQIEDNDFVETMATKLKKRFDEKVAELTAVQTELFELKKSDSRRESLTTTVTFS